MAGQLLKTKRNSPRRSPWAASPARAASSCFVFCSSGAAVFAGQQYRKTDSSCFVVSRRATSSADRFPLLKTLSTAGDDASASSALSLSFVRSVTIDEQSKKPGTPRQAPFAQSVPRHAKSGSPSLGVGVVRRKIHADGDVGDESLLDNAAELLDLERKSVACVENRQPSSLWCETEAHRSCATPGRSEGFRASCEYVPTCP